MNKIANEIKMNKMALELYLYMGSSQPIIEWLKKEGVKTQKEAKDKLAPLVQSNMDSVASYISQGVSLAGTSNCLYKVLKSFPESV